MKYLVFKHIKDDRGNELLEEIPLFDDFDTAEDVLVWLEAIEGSYPGTRFLVVAASSWVTATIKEKPVTRYAHADGWDDETLKWKKNQENSLHRAVKLAEGLPADAKGVRGKS